MRYINLEIPEKTFDQLAIHARLKNTSVPMLVKAIASDFLKDEREKEIKDIKEKHSPAAFESRQS